MPTYEYACTACDDRFEVVRSFADAPLTDCTACGGTLRKVFSPVGVVFKGSGFYRTDNRPKSTSSTPDSGSAGSAPAATPAKSSSSSDGGGSSSAPAAAAS